MNRISKIWTGAVAYVALVLGAGLSITFNVVDVTEQRGALLDRWDVLTAVAFPVLVVLMVEMFVSRLWVGQPWPMQLLRWAGTISIGGIAMRVSWTHGHDFFVHRGQTGDVSGLGPFAIDLLAIMATALILSGRTRASLRTAPDTDKPADRTADTIAVSTLPDTDKPADRTSAPDTDKPAGQDTFAPWSQTYLSDTGRIEDIGAELSADVQAVRDFQERMAGLANGLAAPDYVPEDMVREFAEPAPILPERKRSPRADEAEIKTSIRFQHATGKRKAEIDRAVAEAYGCSPKTIYRIRATMDDLS